jgi:uncharacterized membrane protein YGL010W
MKTLTDHLAQYAFYHQNEKNVHTHFVGIPMIVLAVTTLLSRPVLSQWGALDLTPALLVALLSTLFYLRLDVRFGLAMGALLALFVAGGQWIANQTTTIWLVSGVGLFVVGWAFQFLGHHYEGKKPAFVDDLVGLLIGPLFLLAEVSFAFHSRKDVRNEIQKRLANV